MLATGTPEHLATVPESHTGVFLAEILEQGHAAPGPAATRKKKSTTAPRRREAVEAR